MSDYVSHLASDSDLLSTACQEPWQEWQAPADLDMLPSSDPRRLTLNPVHQPRPHQDIIRLCRACQTLAMGANSPLHEEGRK